MQDILARMPKRAKNRLFFFPNSRFLRLFDFRRRQQARHAPETHGERIRIVQQRRGRRGQDARHAETDQHKVEADDVSVIRVDPVHERAAEPPQCQKRIEVVRADGDVRHLAGDGRAVADGDSAAASASESAGESFTPSPSMITRRPASCSRRMKLALSSGRTSE